MRVVGVGQRVRDTVKMKYGGRGMEMELWGEKQTGGLETGEVCGELSEVLLISERLRGPVTCH